MSAEMRPEDWVRFTAAEYLDDFIKSGGAAVKFVVPFDAPSRAELTRGFMESASDRGYVSVAVSAAETRIHMIDQIFFRIAACVDWTDLARRVLGRLAVQDGYVLPNETGPFLSTLAGANQIGEDFLRAELRKIIGEKVFRRASLAKDFRIAMTQLCLAQLASEAEGQVITHTMTEWLTGQTKTVGALKPFQIFTRINRTNARFLLESLLDWIRFAGLSGLVLLIDAERLTLAKNPRDGSVNYTKASRLDAYELFRQFIDATDRATGFMLVVVPDAEFLDLSHAGRGINEYQALKFRIYDEVRDMYLANPLAALVRVSSRAPAMMVTA